MSVLWRVIRQKRFIIGFLIFAVLLFLSLAFEHVIRPLYPKTFTPLIFDKEGYLIGKAPSPPSALHPLGTDFEGIPYELLMLPGLKQFVGIALAVTILRVGLSFLMAIVISSLKKRMYYVIEHICHVFQFIPSTLIAFIVLAPIRIPDEQQQAILWITVLSCIALPNLSVVIAAEMRKVKSREFIEATRTLGGGTWHIFHVHVLKFLKSKLVILFNQQFVQVMVIMIALSFVFVQIGYQTTTFHLFTHSKYDVSWTGLIMQGKRWIWVKQWLLINPALAVFIIIASIQMMASAVRKVAEGEDIKISKKKYEQVQTKNTELDFDFVHRHEVV